MSGSFTLDREAVDYYQPIVQQVSSEYSKKYRMVEREDISQELWMWFAKHKRKMTEWNEYDEKDRIKLVAKSLRNAAYDYCFKQKALIEGYDPSDVFFYKKDFVKLLLPAVINSDWSRIENSVMSVGKSMKSLAESNDWLAFNADIRRALDMLSPEERTLVVEFYGNDIDGNLLHEQFLPDKGTARAAMMQANRALNKMVRILGGFAPKPDSAEVEDGRDSDVRTLEDGEGILDDVGESS